MPEDLPIRALVVDDEPSVLALTRIFLEETGTIECDTVESAREALDRLQTESYSAVIADYQMPGMDGIELLKAVRAINPEIPFIIFTGKGREDVVIEALNSGADFYLQKGGDPGAQYAELVHKVRQAVQRRRAEDALIRTQFSIDHLSAEFYWIDPDGFFIDVNEFACQELGYPRDELIGMRVQDVDPDYDLEKWYEVWGHLKEIGSLRIESHHRKHDGTIYPVELSLTYHRMGEKEFMCAFATDITGRTRAEQRLCESEARYRSLVELSPDAILIQQEGVVTYANPAALKLFGASSPDELVGKKSIDLAAPEYRDTVSDRIRELQETKTIAPYAVEILRLDGQRVDVETAGSLMYQDGVPSGQIVVRDITERKVAEEALRVSEEKYRTLIEGIDEVVFRLDLQGCIAYASPALARLSAYSQQEIIGQPFSRFIHPEDLPGLQASFERTLAGKREPYEFRVLTKDGTVRHVLSSSRPLLDDGRTVGAIGVLTDITERKQVEEALQRVRYSIDRVDDSFFWVGKDSTFIDVNESACLNLGYSREELLGMSITEIDPHWSLERWSAAWHDLKRQKSMVIESEFHTKDGRTFPVELSVNYQQFGGIEYYCGVARDVTEQKRAEARLKESEKRYRTLVDLAPGPVAVHRGGKFIYVNAACVDLLGGEVPEDLIGRPILQVVHPEDQALVRERIRRMASEGQPVPLADERFIRLDGRQIDVEVVATPITYEGQPSVMVLFLDISERKRAEEEIRELARYPAENPNPVMQADRDGILTYANEASGPILTEWSVGVGETFPPSISGIIREMFAGGASGETEISAMGLVFLIKFTPFMDEGRVNLYGLDVTDARRFRDALASANKKLNLLSSITRHDILNHLAVTRGYLSLAAKRGVDSTLKEYLDRAEAAARAIQKDIEFTKDYQDLGMKTPVWQRVETVMMNAALSISLGGVRLDVVTGPVEVFADPMLENVFVNLLDNAVRHGERVTEIRVSYYEEDGRGVLVIEDDGAGVPAGVKTQIFESGFGRHTGHGLFLVREILDITGIAIAETGEEGTGARFELVVPAGLYRVSGETEIPAV